MTRPVSLAVLLVAAVATSAPEETDMPTFSATTSAVVLDVVVRDGSGRVVRDLKPGDFRVFEDDVEQSMDSFQVVARETPTGAATPAPAAGSRAIDALPAAASPTPSAAPLERPAVIALVFDRLSPSGRDFARRTALDYLEVAHARGDVVGIFGLDLSLRSVAPFSDDPETIRDGIEEAARQGVIASNERDARRDVRERLARLGGNEDQLQQAGLATGGRGSTNTGLSSNYGNLAGAIAVERKAIEIERGAEVIERDQRGYATTRGLLAVVRGLSGVGGRKTVLLFSEGLTIPSAVKEEYRAVIDAANRGNVSFYTVDAGGLRAQSSVEEARLELNSAGDRRERQFITGVIDGSLTRQLERGEEILRFMPGATLGPLAVETGGFYVAGSNDLTDRLREMADDMRFHYVLSYTPAAAGPDGRFRKVRVEVKRRGLKVRTRSGYVASSEGDRIPNGTIRAVVALHQQPEPLGFPMFARALHFPAADGGEGRVPLFVEIPVESLGFAASDDGEARADLTLVVRVLNAAQTPEAMLRQRYAPRADAGDLESLLFHPELVLAPGTYTLEVAAYDAVNRQASVRRIGFEVPEPADGVRLSSLVVAKGVRPLIPQEGPADSPLAIEGSLLQPNLGEVVRRSESPSLGFYFVALADGAAPPEQATVEVWRGDSRVRSHRVRLLPPAGDGFMRQAGSLPLTSLPPDDYRLRVSMDLAGRSVDTETTFTLVD